MTLSGIQELLSLALQADLEQGSHHMTKLAYNEFKRKYPTLWDSLSIVQDIETEEKCESFSPGKWKPISKRT